ncbi:sepiapterin reductase-like [Rhopilema esculentum]|uniref:sepiapterin reductase-like n=1 Tax=Rhopilema esculentum TaxID=499914 RepID=UPI0031D178E3|eukprot:gene931-10687_t
MNFDDKTFCLITGASRGFGRSTAVAFAKQCRFHEGSVMILMGRNEQWLNETKRLVNQANCLVSVEIVLCDLENLDTLNECISHALGVNCKEFATAILVNNAGSLGEIKVPVKEQDSLSLARRYFDLNITSVFHLTSKFVAAFKSSKKFVINISSLAAIQEMQFMSFYCSGKAARDMFHKCLACEETEIRVLNYAPGPMETAMSMNIQQNCGNEASREFFKAMREKNSIIQPDTSADKLVRILRKNEYKSGDHIDFYDFQ